MKTEHAIIAAVVIVGVLFAVSSLMGMTSETTTTTAVSSSSTTTASSITSSTSSSSSTTSSLTSTTTATSTTATTSTTSPPVADLDVVMRISADRGIYYSGNMLNLSVSLDSSRQLPGAQLKVYGIMAGYYRIDQMEKIDVEAGENSFGFSYKTPNCYSCGGIRPGRYNLTAELIYYGKIIATRTTGFEMKQ